MRTMIIAGLIGAAGAFPALAADPPGPVPTFTSSSFDWTGFYAGLHIGYGWGDVDIAGGAINVDVDGILGGGQIGYNWQTDQWVWGIEGDISAAGMDGATGAVTADEEWIATIRGRVGYTWDQWLLFASAGVAFTGVEAAAGGIADDNTHTGWTAGAGIEYGFNQNWTMRAEYLYIDFDDEFYAVAGGVPAEKEDHIFRIAMNYIFNTPTF